MLYTTFQEKVAARQQHEVSNNQDSSSLSRTKINPYYLIGFIDGLGCFNVAVFRNREMATGLQVIPSFQISLHTKDRGGLY